MSRNENTSVSGRLPGSRVRVEEPQRRVFISDAKDACESTINVIRRDGVVRELEITCSCGRTTRLECQYDETEQ